MLRGKMMKYIQSLIVLLIPVIFNNCANNEEYYLPINIKLK